jgi:hypothetical protein
MTMASLQALNFYNNSSNSKTSDYPVVDGGKLSQSKGLEKGAFSY